MTVTFDANSTTDDVLAAVDLSDKRTLVTGVSSGLGVETARALAARGAQVVGAARDLDKACQATSEIPRIELIELDLASLASVRAAADKLVADGRPFDLVVANAGVMATPKGETADGLELQLGTNHLGHFVLVNRIASLIREGGRVVSLSSSAHYFADIDLADPGFESTPYDPWVAYGRSKTATALFAVGFDHRHRTRGVRAAAVHPGVIMTKLSRHMKDEEMENLRANLDASMPEGETFPWKTIPQGAATSVWAGVTAPADEVGGKYSEDCHVAEITSDGPFGVRAYAIDPASANALWAKSEELVGERF